TWDRARFDLAAESRPMPVAEIWAAIGAMSCPLVVITGGEPLLQQQRLARLAALCRAGGPAVEIGTNGTIPPRGPLLDAADRFTVGLKLANSGMPAARRLRPPAIEAFAASGKATWKFVATSLGDLEEIAGLQQHFGLRPVWVMPEGTSSARVL